MDDTYTLTAEVEVEKTRAALWEAWKNPESVAKWWGPTDFSSTVEELEVTEGGKLRIVMHGPDGVDYPNTYVFDKVSYPYQLVYTNVGSKQFGLEPFQSVVDFKEDDGKTKIILKMRFTSQEEKDKHINQFQALDGSRQLLERLGEQAK